jgi:hypothetical protein
MARILEDGESLRFAPGCKSGQNSNEKVYITNQGPQTLSEIMMVCQSIQGSRTKFVHQQCHYVELCWILASRRSDYNRERVKW